MIRASLWHIAALRDADTREWKGARIAPEGRERVEEKLPGTSDGTRGRSARSSRSLEKGGVGNETVCRHIHRDERAGGHLHHRCNPTGRAVPHANPGTSG